MIKSLFTLAALLVFTLLGFSQQTNNWYFGFPGGTRIDFGTNPPTVSSGLLTTAEGSSAISDNNGKPLFYTSGTNLYNATVTPNTLVTSSLLGDPSGTQSAIIMPKPGTTDQWLVFTGNTDVDGTNKAGLNYYTVTRPTATTFTVSGATNLAGTDEIGEGLAIIGSTNPAYSFWVIVREVNLPAGSNNIRAYPVTTGGSVVTTPVTSSAGGITTVAKQGFIKANTCQNKLAFTYMTPGKAEVYDFDATAGQVVAGSLTTLSVSNAYGVEFSPKSSYLFVTELAGKLHQFTIGANGAAWADFTYNGGFGAVQLAPNGLIYTANISNNALGVHSAPDATPATANFSATGLAIPNGVFRGLPNFPKSLIINSTQIIPGQDTTICKGTTLNFDYSFGGSIGAATTDFQWDIFDPSQSSSNSRSTFSHTFNNATAAGAPIKLRLTIKDVCNRVTKDSLNVTVLDMKTPSGTLSCSGNTLTMTGNPADADLSNYVWYDASSGGNIYGTGGTVTWIAPNNAYAPPSVWVEIGATASTTSGSGSVNPSAASLNFQAAGALTDMFSVLADRVTLKTFSVRPSAWPYSISTTLGFDVEIKNGAATVYKQTFSFPSVTAGATSASSTLVTATLNVDLIKSANYTITISNVTSSNATYPLSGWYTYSGTFPQTSAGNFSNLGPASGNSIFGNFTFDYKKSTVTKTCSNRVKIDKLCSLPLSWLFIDAAKSGSNTLVKWGTATEINNDRFDIESSVDGVNFTVIGSIRGSGTTTRVSNYQFVDSRMLSGKVYYRIVQYDYNGANTYSPIAVVDTENSGVKLYPNPTNGELTVSLLDRVSEITGLKIYNSLGQEVYTTSASGYSKIIDLSNLVHGVYSVKVITSDSEFTEKLIKQ